MLLFSGIEEKMFDALLDFFKSIGKLGMDEIEYGLLIAIIIFNSGKRSISIPFRMRSLMAIYCQDH